MSDAELHIDFKFNADEAARETAKIKQGANDVNETVKEGNAPIKEREGILERLRRRQAELRQDAEKSLSFSRIGKINSEIQLFENEITRLTRMGRQGFDDMGNAIPDFERPKGLLERLTVAANLYKRAILEATNPAQIAKYNVKLQQTQSEINRLTNVGKPGFDSMGRAMASHEGILQRLNRAAAIYQRGMMEATNLVNLEKYTQKLALVQAQIAKLTKGVNVGGGGQWNGLQNSINQIARELPAFTYSAQTGFMAISNNIPILIDEINRLKNANAALNAEGKKGVPVWRQVLSGLLSWQTAMMVGITLTTVYGKEIGSWITALFKGKSALAALKKEQEAFIAARLKGAQDGQRELVSMQTLYRAAQNTTHSYKERKKAVDELQNQYPGYFKNMSDEQVMAGKAAGAYDKLKTAIIAAARARAYQDKIAELASKRLENEDKLIALAVKSIDKQKQLEDKRKKLNETDAFGNVHGYNYALAESSSAKTAVEVITSDIKDLNEANGRLDKEMQRYQKSIDNLVEGNGVSVLTGFGDSKDKGAAAAYSGAYRNVLNIRKDALQKIADLDREYAGKALDSDAEEMQALRDKFDGFRRVLEEENEKIRQFNAKNKTQVALVDISFVNPIEARAASDLTYSQDTAKASKAYDELKELYDNYQSYKNEVGEQEADKRYASELSKIKGFYAKLSGEVNGLQSKKLDAGLSGVETDRLEMLTGLLKEYNQQRKSEEDQFFAETLLANQTYEQKRQKIIADSEKQIIHLTKEGKIAQAEVARKIRDEMLLELSKNEIESLGGIDNLSERIEGLSYAAQIKGIQAAEDVFEAWIKNAGLAEGEAEKLRKSFKKLINESKSGSLQGLAENLMEITNEVHNIGAIVAEVDEGFARMVSTVADLLAGVIQVGNGLAKMKESQKTGNTLSGLSGFLSAYGMLVNVGSGIFNAITKASEQRWNDQVLLRTKEIEAQNRLLEYQIGLVDTLNGTAKLDKQKENLKEAKKLADQTREELAGVSVLSGNSSIDGYIKDLNSGKRTIKQLEGYRRSLQIQYDNSGHDAAKQANLSASIRQLDQALNFYRNSLKLTGKESLEELIRLSESFDEETIRKIESLKEHEKQLRELKEAISESVVGFSSKSMVDEIVSMFAAGKLSAKDFTDNFESLMKKAIINSLQARMLEEPLQALYADMQKRIETNQEARPDGSPLTDQDMIDLEKKYNEIMEDGKKKLDAWSKVTGLDFSESDNGSLGTSGIERVSEQTATELMGVNRATYDVNKQQLTAILNMLAVASSSYEVFLQSAQHLMAIELNTANTVTELKNAVGELKSINKNTKGGHYAA